MYVDELTSNSYLKRPKAGSCDAVGGFLGACLSFAPLHTDRSPRRSPQKMDKMRGRNNTRKHKICTGHSLGCLPAVSSLCSDKIAGKRADTCIFHHSTPRAGEAEAELSGVHEAKRELVPSLEGCGGVTLTEMARGLWNHARLYACQRVCDSSC